MTQYEADAIKWYFHDRGMAVDVDALPLGCEELSKSMVVDMGYTCSPYGVDFEVSRWFEEGEWSKWSLVSSPLIGLMNGGLGASEVVGYVSFFIYDTLWPWDSAQLAGRLERLQHRGFVTFGMATTDIQRISSVSLGLPFPLLFNVLEAGYKVGRPEDIFYTANKVNYPTGVYLVSSILSRWPYPRDEEWEEVVVTGLLPGVCKHFWRVVPKSGRTCQTLIGVSSAWGNTAGEAVRRCIRTCMNITVPEAQYRSDPRYVVAKADSLESFLRENRQLLFLSSDEPQSRLPGVESQESQEVLDIGLGGRVEPEAVEQ